MGLLHTLAKSKVQDKLREAGIRIGGRNPQDVIVNDERFYEMLGFQGLLGLGHAYTAGYWDCRALDQFFDKALRAGLLESTKWAPCAIWDRAKHVIWNMQSVTAAKHNSGSHYNISNTLYEYMLDPHMQYTCAYWPKGETDLAAAQECKLRMVCDKLDLQPGMRVLDMGCGWGGLARYMTEHHDVSVVGINLSERQIDYANAQKHSAKLGQSCSGAENQQFHYCDYRSAPNYGVFDRVVSIGMGEHVGVKNYPAWMDVIKQCLKPDGLAVLHLFGRNSTSAPLLDPWTRRYIFPGLELPTLRQLVGVAEGKFNVADVHEIGSDHYGPTLKAWHHNFVANWEKIVPSVAGTNFSKRGWEYYLLSAKGAFDANAIRLWQMVLTRPTHKGYVSIRPESRRQEEGVLATAG